MKARLPFSVAILVVLFVFVQVAYPHFHTPLPKPAFKAVKKGNAIEFEYFWGHPYEHIIFDTPVPDSIWVLAPDGKTRTDLSKSVKKVKKADADGRKVTNLAFSFTPEKRGDHILCLNAPAIFIEEEELFWQDYVKLNIHVSSQKGWDSMTGQKVELVQGSSRRAGGACRTQWIGKDDPVSGDTRDTRRRKRTARSFP